MWQSLYHSSLLVTSYYTHHIKFSVQRQINAKLDKLGSYTVTYALIAMNTYEEQKKEKQDLNALLRGQNALIA